MSEHTNFNEYFEVLRNFIDEHQDNPGLLKLIGAKIEDGALVKELQEDNKRLEVERGSKVQF